MIGAGGSMAKVLEVARCLIRLAAAEEERDYLSPLRLQKLLYYVQGWSLALQGKAMFNNRIEAWVHGPVVPDVYRQYAKYGDQPIPPDDIKPPKDLSSEECSFIESVWRSYKGYSAISLREMTHKEAPWIDARSGLGPSDKGSAEITHKSMKRYFKSSAAS
jgi:uncharacterized phage-associated protein